jgi:hypothetical protein
MTNAEADAAITVLQVRCEQRIYPPHDRLHGTPHPMLQRLLRIETTKGSAMFEQSDYGHPGRLNPWDPRGIDNPLQGKAAQLRALADAVGVLLD